MKIVPIEVQLLNTMGSDLTVVNAARVSFSKESEWAPIVEGCEGVYGNLSDKDKKLIEYLARHNHWTPFAHVAATFFIKAPIFVARQLVKHQVGLVWNEVSRRYVDAEPEYFMPNGWRTRPEGSVKQGSGDKFLDAMWGQAAMEHMRGCHVWYMDAIAAGMAPEQARMLLPQNTMTEWWWTGSLAAFARVCALRLDPHAQQETQDVARSIHVQLSDVFPNSWKALMRNTDD